MIISAYKFEYPEGPHCQRHCQDITPCYPAALSLQSLEHSRILAQQIFLGSVALLTLLYLNIYLEKLANVHK